MCTKLYPEMASNVMTAILIAIDHKSSVKRAREDSASIQPNDSFIGNNGRVPLLNGRQTNKDIFWNTYHGHALHPSPVLAWYIISNRYLKASATRVI